MTPPAILLHELADARRRGEDFEEAFPLACEAALAAASSGKDRYDWTRALTATRDAWAGAYERRAAVGAVEVAVRELAV
jgi:hypothetical protein